tara:strand:+ start:267 stop:1625 length:1359 start_codon:yes stop_codon:yes gene_type:complete
MALRFNMSNPNWRQVAMQQQSNEFARGLGEDIATLGGALGKVLNRKLGPARQKFAAENERRRAANEDILTEDQFADFRKDFRAEKKEERKAKKAKRKWEKTFKKLERQQKKEDKASLRAKRKAERLAKRKSTPVSENETKSTPVSKNKTSRVSTTGGVPIQKFNQAVKSAMKNTGLGATLQAVSDTDGIENMKNWFQRNILGNKLFDDYRYTSPYGPNYDPSDESQIRPTILEKASPVSMAVPSPLGQITNLGPQQVSEEMNYGTGVSDYENYGTGVTEAMPTQPGYSDEYGTYDESGDVIDYYKGTSPTQEVAEPSGFRPYAPGYEPATPSPLSNINIPGLTDMISRFENTSEEFQRDTNNPYASIYTPTMAQYGALPSERSFVGSDGRTYHYGKYPSRDQARIANEMMMANILRGAGGNIPQAIANYIGTDIDDPQVKSRVREAGLLGLI